MRDVKLSRSAARGSIAGVALTALLALPAQAQQQTPPPRPDDMLGDIIVTAEKREESLQKVPISITAMTGETLLETGISNVEDLQFFVPGVSVTNDAQAIINIRGIGTSSFGIATDPSTTVHYDGVYIPRPTTSYQDMFDVERVEVLRGPQGMLFGRNSAGGTFNIVSKMPTKDFSGTLGVRLGNYNKRTFSGTVAGPVGEKARMRVTLVRNRRDGLYRDVVTGKRYQNEDNLAGRVTLAIDASERLEIIVRADATRDRETGYPGVRDFYPPEFAAAGAIIPTGRDDIALDKEQRYDIDAWGFSSTVRWDAGPVTLKSITAVRKSDVARSTDIDSTSLFLRDIEVVERSRMFSQELQLLNNGEGAANWIVGAFYMNEKGRDQISILQPRRALVVPETNTTNALAFFGQLNYEIVDRLRLTGGLRYSYERKNFAFRRLVNSILDASGEPDADWTAWTPKFGIDYEFSDNAMIYASATRGFKSGGFQLGDSQPFLPEYLWSYETGLKATLFDRRLRANMSAFYYDYTDLQVVQYINGVANTSNAGQATIKGFEAEFAARPAHNFTLNSTIAYLDARYDVYFDRTGSLAGKRLPNAPEWNFTLGGDYKIALGNSGHLILRADAAWRSRVFFRANNNPNFQGERTTLINSRLAWRSPSESWELALYGRNLTNQRYVTYKTAAVNLAIDADVNQPKATYGEPRQYGVELRYSF
ncbi:MAG: TonB-dependent receptor [Sphingomonas sp.]|nr:TonB-dependent receptor [Sphingomonas sp.]